MWAIKRRILIVFFVFCLVTFPAFYLSYKGLFHSPTCTDGAKNGLESGVDCGGECQLICKENTIPVSVSWASYFKNDNGSYDVALMLHNSNQKTTPEYVAAFLSVYSINGSILYTSQATTSVPIGGDELLVIQNIYFRDFPARITTNLTEGRSFISARDRGADITTKVFFDRLQSSSISVEVTNNTNTPILRAPLRVIAYGADMRPLAVTETRIDRIDAHSSAKVFAIFGKNFITEPFAFKAFVHLPPYDSKDY